jgi:hypothetical protein
MVSNIRDTSGLKYEEYGSEHIHGHNLTPVDTFSTTEWLNKDWNIMVMRQRGRIIYWLTISVLTRKCDVSTIDCYIMHTNLFIQSKPQIVPCDHPTIACIGSANRVKAISDHDPKL